MLGRTTGCRAKKAIDPACARGHFRLPATDEESGAVVGVLPLMVTLEDIQEEIVGEFVGVGYNFPGYVHRERHQVPEIGDDAYVLDACVPVSEVNELLAIALPTRVAHTIGGFVTAQQLRHLPRAEEEVHAEGFRFIVEESNGKTVRRLRVESA